MVEVALVVAILRTTLTGENAHIKPVEGETVAVSEIVAVKP
jgi:hypothetical protein